ncbi:MAG: DUF7089 family protein [Halobacteriota archaeon]|uniref:DUF7089 family protein n=1 Tax=Natronomonas sp. TaxID=2184060 RepID=UPI00397490AB
MFDERTLSGELDELRRSHAPSTLVFDAQGDFETLPPSIAENLLAVTDGLEPLSYDVSWLPPDAPETLHRIAGSEFTIGAPGDGGIAWTRQTIPPVVLVKPRLEGSPEGFTEFLIAEALVEIGLGDPEHFLGFFEGGYRELAEAVPLSPADTYQLAVALLTAFVGRSTRPVFADWEGEFPALHAEWVDAGERLRPRLGELSRDVAIGRTGFSDAAELACSAVKHDLDLPTPFAALDSSAYEQYGPSFGVRWAQKTFEALDNG